MTTISENGMGNDTANRQAFARALRNTGALTLAIILSKGGLFLWQLILISLLGKTLYGVYVVVGSSMILAASFSTMGMSIIIMRDVARRPQLAGRYWSAALALQTGLAVLAYPLMMLATGLDDFPQQELVLAYLGLVGINLFLDSSGNIGHDLLLAQERMQQAAIISILHLATLMSLGLGALYLDYGLQGVYVGSIIASATRSLALNGLLWRGGLRPARFSAKIARPLFLNGLPIGLNALLVSGVTQLDKQIIARILGPESAAHLAAESLLVVGMIEVLGTPQLTAFFPLHARLQNDARAPRLPERISYFILLWSVPLSILLSALAPTLVGLLFGAQDFAHKGDLLRILVWYGVLAITNDIFSQTLMMQNRQRSLLWIRALGLGLNLTLNLTLLTTWRDIRGVAIATVSSELFVLALLCWQLRRYGIRWRVLMRRIFRLSLVVVLAALLIWQIGALSPWLAALMACGVYALALWRGGLLDTDERQWFRSGWQNLRRRLFLTQAERV